MKNPLFQPKRYLVLFFIVFNQVCFAQTQITDFKYQKNYPEYFSLVGKINNTIFFTQRSIYSITSVWSNTIGDSTTKFIGRFPDMNLYNFSSYIFNNRVYFLYNNYPFSSELWTCDSTEGSLRQVYKFEEVGSIFIFNNQMLFKGKGLSELAIDETNKNYELKTLINNLSSYNLDVLDNFIIDNNYLEKTITILDKNLKKQVNKFPNAKGTEISDIVPLGDSFTFDTRIINSDYSTLTEQYIYNISQKEFTLLVQKTGKPVYSTFYYSKDTLNLVEFYGSEKNYSILRSEIIDGKKVEKLNISFKKSLGFPYWSLIFYSNFKIINDDLHFLSYTFDSTNRNVTKEKYLERLSLKTGKLESYLVNEISRSLYPIWDYSYEGLLFSLIQEGDTLKISLRNSRNAPILGFDLNKKEIIKFDTLSQPNSLSISIGNSQFLWLENNNLNFLDTLKRSTRIVETFKEQSNLSSIEESYKIDENLFLRVRSSENEFSVHNFDGEKLQKIVINDTIQYFDMFNVSGKLLDNSYLLFFKYKYMDSSSLAIYSFNSLTKQMRILSTVLYSDLWNFDIQKVLTSGGIYFFKKGYYQNVVTDLTNEGTKILPKLNKQDSQDILHVSAKGNVLVRERETLSLIKPPYINSTIIGKFGFAFPYFSYGEKLFFFSDRKLYVYENEKIRLLSIGAYSSNVYIQRVSNDEVVFWDPSSSIYQINLRTEEISLIYDNDRYNLQFLKKVNNDYFFRMSNQSDDKNQLLVYNGSSLKTKVVLTYGNQQKVNVIGDFSDQFVWALLNQSNTIIDYGIYKDGVAKRIDDTEIAVFDKSQQLEIIFDPDSKELKFYDLSFGSGVTKVPVNDSLLRVVNKQKFGNYYAFGVNGIYLRSKDNYSNSLWVTDGTKGNTIRVADGLGHNLNYLAIGSKMYFAGNNDQTGNEIWETDGTIIGTRRIADIWKGTISSSPSNLMKIGKYLYCFATTGESGRQLWRIKEVEDESDIVLGIEGIIENSAISVYPNPFSDFLSIKSDNLDLKNAKIELFDLIGKKVQEMDLENVNTINLSSLPNGIYTLRIIVNGKKYSSKIVKY